MIGTELPRDNFSNNIYYLFMEVTDACNMANVLAKPLWSKVAAILAGMSGIVIFSMLVAMITAAL